MNEQKVVLDTVEMISKLMGELESKAFEKEGFSEITMRQMLYLETIGQLEQPTSSDLAHVLEVTAPSVSGIIKKLVQLGFVSKEKSAQDGRVYYLLLTDKGKRFNQLHGEVHQILAQRIIKNLTHQEIEKLAGLLAKIT